MTWWQQIQQSYLADLAKIDATLKADLERAFASGATTPAEQERAIDQRIAAIDDPDARAQAIAVVEAYRGQLTADLRDSGYGDDGSSLTRAELAQLVAERGLNAVSGTGAVPTESGSAAAAAAALAGGSSIIDHRSGAIEILDAQGKLHAYIPPGQEAPPASTIAGEIVSDSVRGGARPLREQVEAAFAALQDAGWDPNNPGDAGVTYPGNGDILATFPDGSTRIFGHDPIAQLGRDLEVSSGDPAQIAEVLDRAAAGLGDAAFGAVTGALGNSGWPNLGGTTSPGTNPGGTTSPGSTGTGSTGGSTSSGGSGGSGGSNAPTSPERFPMDDADPVWKTGDDKPASSGTPATTEPAAEPAAAAPAAAANDGKNSFMTEEEQEAAAAAATDNDGEDGWEDSTKKPPTDGTYVDADGDGNPDEEDDASSEEDDDDDDEDDDDDADESATAVGYTPRPGDDEVRNLTPAEVAALLGASPGGPNDGWSDGTNVKPTEFDPAFMVAAQQRKEGMIGQPGTPDIDLAPGAGPGLPDQSPGIDPDDDTPGHTPDGHDVGHEDRMRDPVPTFDATAGFGGGGSSGPTIAPQEMVVAEVNIARVSVAGAGSLPALPGYGQTTGGAASGSGAGGVAGSADAPNDSASPSTSEDFDPAAAASESDATVPILEMVEAEINVDLGSRSLTNYQYALGGTAGGDASDRSSGDGDDGDAGGRG